MQLRKIRKENFMPAIVLAEAIGKKVSTYYQKECGKINFTIEEMEKIAKMLEVTEQEIFFND